MAKILWVIEVCEPFDEIKQLRFLQKLALILLVSLGKSNTNESLRQHTLESRNAEELEEGLDRG